MRWGPLVGRSVRVFLGLICIRFLTVVSGTGVLGFWLGLELGAVSFLVLCNSRTVVENEGSTKYYLVQRSSSRLLFVGLVGVFFGELLARDGAIWATMVCLAAYIMWVKLGLFPCHFWVVPVLQRVGWGGWFWIAVVQKVSGFWIISGMALEARMVRVGRLLMVLTSLVGCLGGLGQVKVRSIMGYSSLVQRGWIGLLCFYRGAALLIYGFVYGLMMWGFTLWASRVGLGNVSNARGLSGDLANSWAYWVVPCIYFLSLAGCPPFVGFGLKFIGLVRLLSCFWVFVAVLLVSSAVRLYYYLVVFINSIVGTRNTKFKVRSGVLYRGGWLMTGLLGLNVFGGLPLIHLMLSYRCYWLGPF